MSIEYIFKPVIEALSNMPEEEIEIISNIIEKSKTTGKGFYPNLNKFVRNWVDPDIDDPIIIASLQERLIYPDCMRKVLYPKLEFSGPAEFNVTKLKKWRHDAQQYTRNGDLGGKIFSYIKENNMIESCLGLHELKCIKNRGAQFFDKYYPSYQFAETITGWRSAIMNDKEAVLVPSIRTWGGDFNIHWLKIGSIDPQKNQDMYLLP